MSHRLKIDGQVDWVCPVNWLSPLNRGLAAWWLALPGVTGGSRFLDLCGKNHGTLSGGPTWRGALSGSGGWGGIKFDGTDDHVETSALAGAFNLSTNPWSLGAIVNFSTAAGTQCFVSLGTLATNSTAVALTTRTAGSIRAENGGGAILADSGVTPTVGQTYHVFFTWDGTTSRIYLDGVEKGSSTTAPRNITPAFINFGRYKAAGQFDLYSGSLDAVPLYGRALSAADVMGRFNDSRQGYPTTLNRIRLPVLGEAGGAAPAGPGGHIIGGGFGGGARVISSAA